MFRIDHHYTKKDIYNILSVPEKNQKGAWDTGYRMYEGDIYIFANVGIPGRTGSDYNNFWDGEFFHWEAKTNSKITQPLIKKMISSNPDYNIQLFTRTDNNLPFTYEGNMIAASFEEAVPVKIIWTNRSVQYLETSSGYNVNEKRPLAMYEGGRFQVILNKYERNPLARRMCIDHYGWSCQICSFNFQKTYGDLGKGYIQVHHIVPLADIGEYYQVNFIEDLIPVCPNCHAMIHRGKETSSVNELKSIINLGNDRNTRHSNR